MAPSGGRRSSGRGDGDGGDASGCFGGERNIIRACEVGRDLEVVDKDEIGALEEVSVALYHVGRKREHELEEEWRMENG